MYCYPCESPGYWYKYVLLFYTIAVQVLLHHTRVLYCSQISTKPHVAPNCRHIFLSIFFVFVWCGVEAIQTLV